MSKFRKKPVVVEAWHFIPRRPYTESTMPEWLSKRINVYGVPKFGDVVERGSCLEIHTPEGVMGATFGDWIIKGVKGEIYPCKPDIFAATYEAVEP